MNKYLTFIALVLAGCGGDGGDATFTPQQVVQEPVAFDPQPAVSVPPVRTVIPPVNVVEENTPVNVINDSCDDNHKHKDVKVNHLGELHAHSK